MRRLKFGLIQNLNLHSHVKVSNAQWALLSTTEQIANLQCPCVAKGSQDPYHVCYECEWTKPRVDYILEKTNNALKSHGTTKQLTLYDGKSRNEQITMSMGGVIQVQGSRGKKESLNKAVLKVSTKLWSRMYIDVNKENVYT